MFKPNDVVIYTVTKEHSNGIESYQCEAIIHHVDETNTYCLAARAPGEKWTIYNEIGGALMSDETSDYRLHPDPDLVWAAAVAAQLAGTAEEA